MDLLTTVEDFTKNTKDVPLESIFIYRMAVMLWNYGSLVIVVLGTFGNVMAIVIMRRMTSSAEPTINIFFTALAVVDLVTIYSRAFQTWTEIAFDFAFRNLNSFTCKLYFWLSTSTATMSGWLLVSLTAHRALSVVWPHRVNLICTRRLILVTICLIVGVFAGLYSHYLYGFDLISSDNSTASQCWMTSPEYIEFAVGVFSYVDLLFFSLLPFTCLVLCNGVLIWKLAASLRQARRHLTPGNVQQVQTQSKTTNSVTLTVIVVSLTYIILNLPLGIYYILFYVVFEYQTVGNEEYAKVYMFAIVSGLLLNVNNAINFYLYCLTGRKFRQEFVHLLTCSQLKKVNKH